MSHPCAWIAQDFIDPPPWDGQGEPPTLEDSLWDGTGPAPPLDKARGHIEPSEGDSGPLEEGEWDDVEDAIAWARERAPYVVVRVGYSGYYSAGKIQHPDYKPWPPTDEAIRSETRRGRDL